MATGEIFCSANSPLTQQAINLGEKCFRFGLGEGDLSTQEGRAKLLRQVVRHRPRNLWYSPTCGPWSSWSSLNSSKSVHHWQINHDERNALLYQLALGIVLYRHQLAQGHHFHWEQPARSLMFKQPGMSELQQHTQTCEFDMCRAGDLRDPSNNLPMQKRMNVVTTSPTVFKSLHGLLRRHHHHEHQRIEGSTHNSQGRILRSSFTEVYPRKFARMMAKILSSLKSEKPFLWNPRIQFCSACPTQETVFAVGTRAKPYRDRFPKSELVCPTSETESTAKRRRLTGKQNTPAISEMCTTDHCDETNRSNGSQSR